MTAEIILAFIAGYIMRAWVGAAQQRMRARKLEQGFKSFGEMLARLAADIQAKKDAAAIAQAEQPSGLVEEPFGYISPNRRPRRRL